MWDGVSLGWIRYGTPCCLPVLVMWRRRIVRGEVFVGKIESDIVIVIID